jgi:transposase-like protein
VIIRRAVWLYVRFTLSYRDVEDLFAERGLDVSYETVRRWVLKFGPIFARELRRRRPRPTSRWHLDEMAVMIAGSSGCGARSTTRARFSICSCSDGATRLQR